MTKGRTNLDRTIEGVRRGSTFDVVLPNFGTAGYRWEPKFDEHKFELLGIERREGRGDIVFRFRARAGSDSLTFELSRRGQPPHEIRNVLVQVSDS